MARIFWIELLKVAIIVLGLGAIALLPRAGLARDLGQWANMDPEIQSPEVTEWMGKLLQPDTIVMLGPGMTGQSCCGRGDAYWVEAYVRWNWQTGQEIVAIITDERDDRTLGRIHEDVGTQYVVPANKIVGEKQRAGNPTGKAILFLGEVSLITPGGPLTSDRVKPRQVLCFVDNNNS